MTNHFKLILGCLLLFLVGCHQEQALPKLHYQFSYQPGPNPMMKITLTAPADSSGTTIFSYPDQSWGQDSLQNAIQQLEMMGQGQIERKRDSGWLVIEHPKELDSLQFSYTLVQDFQGPPATKDVYRPIIDSSYFQLFGHHLFAFPKDFQDNDTRFDARLDWTNVPEAISLQNSFGSQQRVQELKGIDPSFFTETVHFGGDYRIHEIDIEGNTVALAIRDQWLVFSDSTMVAVLKATVQAQRDFWKDHTQQYFSVSIIPTAEQRGSSYQGTGLPQAFATAASNNKDLDAEGLVYLFNHELQHKWTGQTLKNENEEEQYWFSEGFTDYYTMKNIAKNNIYELDGNFFIKSFNQAVRNLYQSPVRAAPNSEINYDNFWSDRHYSKLPYYRGTVFAGYLDMLINKDSNGEQSLDDVMHDLLQHKDKKINREHFLNTVNKYTAESVDSFFDRHIEQGVLFDLQAIYKLFDLSYQSKSEVFDLGYKRDEALMISEVDSTANIFKAGLRVGDQIRSGNFQWDLPDVEAVFTIRRDGNDFDIRFFPSKPSDIPQLINSPQNLSTLGY